MFDSLVGLPVFVICTLFGRLLGILELYTELIGHAMGQSCWLALQCLLSPETNEETRISCYDATLFQPITQ